MTIAEYQKINTFPTSLDEIQALIDQIDPEAYGKSRNYIDGAVTYLSPYISRGVISTKQLLDTILKSEIPISKAEKLIQELAWRDYWQQIWIEKEEAINEELKFPQQDVTNHQMPEGILKARTGIEAVDQAIVNFYESGYMHNHMRMYVASLACNIGKSYWKKPAQWLYYHLLDGDWASNALSWQWVAGSNSKKKYFANQENINKYCHSEQRNTFLDVPYSRLPEMEIPDSLRHPTDPELHTPLPEKKPLTINSDYPTLIYNYYNLDPEWKSELGEKTNRILLLEPSVFHQYPVSQQSIDFVLKLAENIPHVQLFVGEFEKLKGEYEHGEIYYKEHPLNKSYKGIQESRDWMFSVKGYYPSFFAFWKKCKKEMKAWKT